MPRLTIDGVTVEVPDGTNVLEAAREVGIVIPHFCYHPALGSVGSCRLCAMTFHEGPVKGVQMSCMIMAQDGMVVTTDDGESARLRKSVIEWLMMNHPHDCPVCDEGGQCLLQDYTVSGGHGIRRYDGRKRTYNDQYLGEFVQHEMNRCIQCYRCVRFYKDYAGGDDLGPMGSAARVYFGRHEEGWLTSPFSGNLTEVCPTGVFTDRTFRFRARVWELEQAPSVCPHCSLGCNTTPGGRYRELMRVRARENPSVNGWFICDRGRYGYQYASRPDRPYIPMADGDELTYEGAIDAASDALFEAINMHGADAVAFIGSPRASVESNTALRSLAKIIGSGNVCYSCDALRQRRESAAVRELSDTPRRSLMEISRSDVIVALGLDPLGESPMLALMMRQAARGGAEVYVIDPRPVEMPFEFTHIPALPKNLAGSLSGDVLAALEGAKTPTVIAGTHLCDEETIKASSEKVRGLAAKGLDAGVMYVMEGPNSFGCAMLGPETDMDAVVEGMERGRIKALVALEADILSGYPDPDRARKALGKLESLIVLDHVPSGTVAAANVFIPTPVTAEDDGIYVNNEGRAQAYAKAYSAGIPVSRMGPDVHPPREFRADIPGGCAPAWKALNSIVCRLKPTCPAFGNVAGMRHEAASLIPELDPATRLRPGSVGVILEPSSDTAVEAEPRPEDYVGSGLVFVSAGHVFGTEELSSFSDVTLERAPDNVLLMNPADAAKMGLADGGKCFVDAVSVSDEYTVGTDEGVASGAVVGYELADTKSRALHGRVVKLMKRGEGA